MTPYLIRLQLEQGITLVAKVDLGLPGDPPDVRWEYAEVDGERLDPIEFEQREGYDLDELEEGAIEAAQNMSDDDAEVVNASG
jgi:hypothetical protein